MKKCYILLCFMMILCSGCIKNVAKTVSAYENSSLSFNQKISKYYCPSEHSGFDTFHDVYVPTDDCSEWNSKLAKAFNANAYKDCLKTKRENKEKFEKGLCEKFVVEQKNVGATRCKVEVAKKYKKILTTQCVGTNVESARRQIENEYRRNNWK